MVSPYLKTNERIRLLLEDLDRRKLDIRLIYEKSELQPEEINWLRSTSIRTSFCRHLHAKCYLNERQAIITSMNLYEFSQVNNHEMGILLYKELDSDLYAAAYDEVQQINRISDEIKVSVEHIAKAEEAAPPSFATPAPPLAQVPRASSAKFVSTTQLAKSIGISPKSLFAQLHEKGWIDRRDNQWVLTKQGELAGGQLKHSKDFGEYIVWPEDLRL